MEDETVGSCEASVANESESASGSLSRSLDGPPDHSGESEEQVFMVPSVDLPDTVFQFVNNMGDSVLDAPSVPTPTDLDAASVFDGLESEPDFSFVEWPEHDDGSVADGYPLGGDADEPVLTQSQFQLNFARDLLSNCTAVSEIVMPWEQGVFREIFSDDPIGSVVPQMPVDGLVSPIQPGMEPQLVGEVVASAMEFDPSLPVFLGVISHKDDVDFPSKLEMLRERALSKLLVVIEYSLEASSTGRRIAELDGGMPSRTGSFHVLDAVVGLRSPYTVIKRANTLLGFVHWCSKHLPGVANPFDEDTIWTYLNDLRSTNAAPTKGDSVMSAMRFAYYILGFDSLERAVVSRRLVGICELMSAGKKALKQARALTVGQVRRLHRLLRDEDMHKCDRAICAYLLLALYGRCRHSDLQMIKSVECDFHEGGGYVIVQTLCHKTGKSASLKCTLLPIIIPARGVDGSAYAELAIKALMDIGVAVDCNPIDGPLLPAPVGPSSFLRRGLTSHESSQALRKLLDEHDMPQTEGEDVISSHSLKATCLSWCAKFGLSPSSRSMLGRHASSVTETFAIYSRDLMVAPAAELQKVVDEISKRAFVPDGPRSAFFREVPVVAGSDIADVKSEQADDACRAEPGTSEVVEIEVTNDSSSNDGDMEFPSSDDEPLAPIVPKVKRFRAKIPSGETWYAHKKSKILRQKDDEVSSFWGRTYLKCGKHLSDAYEPCTESNAMNSLCKVCLRKS